MLILAFDTTSPEGGVALSRDSEIVADIRAHGKTNYSVALFEMTSAALSQASSSLNHVDVFAAATGPGSFTGIRVGLAAAQGWAKAFGRPVRGISVLEAMVEAANFTAGPSVSLVDARRGEFYAGVFRRPPSREPETLGDAGLSQEGEGYVVSASQVTRMFGDLARGFREAPVAIVRETDQVALELARGLPPPASVTTVPGFLVSAIASVARQAARARRLQSADELDAYYIRRSDAELNWHE